MTIFVMFFIELLAARFDIFGDQHDLEVSDPAKQMIKNAEKFGPANEEHQLHSGKRIPLCCGKRQAFLQLYNLMLNVSTI